MITTPEDSLLVREAAAQAASFLKTVGNEQRLLVLCLLAKNGEMSVGAMLDHMDLSQSALSQHLAKMREEGLLGQRRESQLVFYRIIDQRVERLLNLLADLYCPDSSSTL